MSDLGVNAGSEIWHSDLAPITPGWAIFRIVAYVILGVGAVVYFVYQCFFHHQQVPGGNPDPVGADDDGVVTAELELVVYEQRNFRDSSKQLGTRVSPNCSICLESFA
ncbi:unnamed protein product [Linum trigynum]|uniref:Uncharacterized protein n=1 Tax=Linum trigynum TaxID=586398 RepID=A0AAV2F413_9ROSI